MIWGKGVGSQLVKDTPSLMTKIGNRVGNVLSATASEGFLEEGTQSTVETMFTNKAKRGELTNNMTQDFNVSELVSSYIENRQREIEKYNAIHNIDKSLLVNGRNMTNFGLFRKYITQYLIQHPGLNQDMILLCRQLLFLFLH